MIEIIPGVHYWPDYLDLEAQRNLLRAVNGITHAAPLFTPRMPRSGKPLSVRMTSCGALGWMSDADGYRYQAHHPDTGSPWPAIPEEVLRIWRSLVSTEILPESCLINFYDTRAKMGLHQDRDEPAANVAVLSISLGADATFRIGGLTRTSATRSMRLRSGDVLSFGGAARHIFHGVDRIATGGGSLLPDGGRINLTIRRVSPT